MKQIVYKVVSRDNLGYHSFNIGTNENGDTIKGPHSLRYAVGKTTRPSSLIPHSKLYAFDTLEVALHYFNFHTLGEEDAAIFKAEGTGVVPGDTICPIFRPEWYKKFWSPSTKYTEVADAPDGTVFCSTIKLLEEVEV